jgi:glyoxylase-like metal-dependent hydrolase (beta-lactamase superfamily II)
MKASYDILMHGFPGRSSRGFLGWSTIVLLQTAKGYALFDTGGVGDRPGLMAALQARGIGRDDIATVVLSHLHFDHMANSECFPKAEIILHEDEYAYVHEHGTSDPAISMSQVEGLLRRPQLSLISGELEVLPGIRVIKTPGHSGGHISVVLNVDGKRVVLAQDAVKHRGELASGHAAGAFDEVAAKASIRRIAELADIVVPGHDGPIRIENGHHFPTDVTTEIALTLRAHKYVLET